MTFDERGRIWITESLEYPRRDAGPGRDRIKVLEDTDGDGTADKFTDLRRRAEHPLGHRRRPRRRVGGQLARHPVPARHRRRRPGRQARSGRHRLRPRRHARAAQLAHLGARRLAVRPQRRLQPQPRRAAAARSIDFTCALFRIHPADARVSALRRGDQQPLGHRLGHRGQRLRQRLRDRPPLAPDRDRLLPSARAGRIRRSPGRSTRSSSTSTRRRPTAASTSSTATPIRPSIASGSTWATSTATASTSTCSTRDGSTYFGHAASPTS